MAYGEEIKWGDSSCSEYAWQANQIVGAADFYPSYGDTALGYDLSAENSGREWIELKFPTNVYVAGFELYETYKPGAAYRVSTAPEYLDNNLVACCGQDFPTGGNCDGRPVCSTDTKWNTIWSGTPGNSGDKATVFSPSMCPYAYQTNIVRVDLDTKLASGWNNFDAAKVFGSLQMPKGLILADSSSGSPQNKVAYSALPGMHGVDTFQYEVTDCLGYGPASTMSVILPEPAAAFTMAAHKSISTVMNSSSMSITLDLSVATEAGIFSLHELLRGSAVGVKVTCKGLVGLTKISVGGVVCTSAGVVGQINTKDWSSSPAVITEGTGHAEVWLQKNESTLTQRVQFHVCPKMSMAFLDTIGYGSADTCTGCFDAPGTLGLLDTITYNALCRDAVEAEKEARALKAQNELTIIIVILTIVIVLVLVIVTWRAVKFLRKVIRSHKEQQEAKRDRCRKAVKSAVTMSSPCYLVKFDTFMEMKRLRNHEYAREKGYLKTIDNYDDLVELVSNEPVVFFSHQWLSWDDPDPDQLQYNEMVASCHAICKMKGFDINDLNIFLDYLSIPQANMNMRLAAINTLGVFSSLAQYFVVVAPDSVHKDTGQPVNKASYQRRGWCRLEQWGHMCKSGMENMYFYKDNQLIAVDDTPEDKGSDWFEESILVFEGDYTNNSNKGEMVDCVLGLYGLVLMNLNSYDSDVKLSQARMIKDQADGTPHFTMNEAMKNLHDLIKRLHGRTFPAEYFRDLPELLVSMLDTDDELMALAQRTLSPRVKKQKSLGNLDPAAKYSTNKVAPAPEF